MQGNGRMVVMSEWDLMVAVISGESKRGRKGRTNSHIDEDDA
jgi:hypothetical protein